jgi:hypothetical protein
MTSSHTSVSTCPELLKINSTAANTSSDYKTKSRKGCDESWRIGKLDEIEEEEEFFDLKAKKDLQSWLFADDDCENSVEAKRKIRFCSATKHTKN